MTGWSGGAPSSLAWHRSSLKEMLKEETQIAGCKHAAAWPDACMLRSRGACGDSGDLRSPARH